MAFDELDRTNEPPERASQAASWDSLNDRDRKARLARRERLGLVGAQDDGLLGEFSDRFQGAVVSGLKGIGATGNELGLGSGMQDYFQGVLDRNQQWNAPEDSGVAGYIGGAVGNALGSTAVIAPAIAADAMFGTKGVATFALVFGQSYGDNLQRNRGAYGPGNEGKSAGLAAVESSVDSFIEIALGTVPMLGKTLKGITYAGKRQLVKGMFREAEKQLGRSGAKRFFLGLARNGAEEMTEEGLQYINSWMWRAMGGDQSNEFKLGEMADNMGQGFIGGAALGVVGGKQNVNLYGKSRPWLNQGTSTQPPDEMTVDPTRQAIPMPPDESTNISARLTEEVAKEMGMKVRFFDEDGAPNAVDEKGNSVNGWYDEKNNEYWIDRNDPEMNPLETLGHEFKHFLDRKHGDLVKTFDELLKSGMNDAGKQALAETEADYQQGGYAAGQGDVEFSADTFGKMWTDPDFWRDVTARAEKLNAGMGQRMLDALQEFIKVVRAKLKNIGTPDAKILFDNMGELRNEAVRIMAEVKRQNGTSTEAENVVGVNGSDMVQSIPVSELNLDPARFQFKSKANKVTGVDESNQLGGEWDTKTAGNLYVWEDNGGKKFVVNGHHRFQLAQNSHVSAVNGIVDREADGVTAEQARRNGVLINIRDEQGDVKDYADFVRHEDMDEKTAEKEGILAREKGRTGYTIGKYASDNLYGLFRSDDISDAKTATISDVARKDEGLEAAGIRAAKTMPNAQLREFLKCLANTPRETTEQGDLFGFDDSAIQLAEKLSKLATKHIREVKEKVNSAKNAIKNPDAARKLGVKVGSSAQKLFDKALQEQQAWEHWYTNPELSDLLKQEAGITNINPASTPDEKSAIKTPVAQKTANIEHSNVASSNEQTNSGRFNQNSDTPLLTPEEDASDFQLYDETPAEARARDAKVERDAETEKEQAQKEAAKNSPDLDFGNMFQNEMKEADEQIQRNRQVVSNNSVETATEKVTQPKDEDVKTLLREVINMQTDGNIKQQRLLRIAKSLGVSEKEIQERCEAEVVAMAREINAENISDDAKYQKMLELYNRQPNFTKRTSTSVANQAYSTPVPLAWLLGKRIGLAGHTVYEPTAGTGMLTVSGNPATIAVNEIDMLRNNILRKQGFLKVTGNDASTTRPNLKYGRIIMNPPFGAGKETTFDGYKLTKLDHIIAARALDSMQPNGSAAIIIGANTEQRDGLGRTAFPDHVFMSYLYDKFNVKDNFIVSGDLYRKQGAGYPVRVLTLSGFRIGGEAVTPPKNIEIIKNWDTLYQRLKGELDHGVSETERSIDAHPATGAGEQKQSSENAGRRSSRNADALGTDRRVSEDRTGTVDGVGELHEQQSGRSGSVGADQSQGRIISEPSEPVNRDGERLGNSSADIHGRTEASGNQSGNVVDGRQSGSERSGTPVQSRGHSALPAVSSSGLQVGEQRGELNNGYIPASKSADKMDVVVPRFMAEAVEHSLHRVGEAVGDIDKFVQSELGYGTPDELYKSLSDVQIDGVAQAITAIRNGDGFVLGDQTGIGKGRQCAAVIRWAQNHGIMPIFLTRDQNLFTDMYRDGKDIGSTFNPLIVASDAGKANINDQSGKKLVGLPPNQALAFSEMIADKSKYDCVFMPYSQLSKDGRQRNFLRSLIDSRKCLLVMDEAHEASGDSARGRFFYGSDGILHKDVGVLYASATFAKRPDNMALYFRTNIRKAVDNIDSLKEILVKGGVPLQQLLSSGLALDGQYTRRERDFTGVKFDTIVADPVDNKSAMIDVDGTKTPEMSARERLIERYDRVAYVLGRLTRHSELIKKVINEAEKDNYGSANTREGQSIQMASFASVTHNYISQLLLASKCDIVVAQAEKAFRNGQKPVIALTNTLESVLSDFVADNGIVNGDPLSMKFSDILESAMLRMYKFTKKTAKGDAKQIQFNPDDYGLGEAHERMLQEIHELDDIDLPISPIDYIKFQLEQRGIRTGEITGRKLIVNYGTAVPTLAARSAKEMNKNRNVNDFNAGNIDAIVLNASGSTGLSLHSSVKFADQKQRNMIMAQPSLDIAVVQQMFGRVLRSGQVNSPAYEILSSPLAAERRPMMVLSRKLQSLNANTTANNKGAVSLGLDFMNKYGDLVAQQYLDENPEVASQVDLDANSGEDSSSVPENLMTKLTGRMAILPDSQQQEILDDLIARYSNMVEFLKKTGNYDLEITVHDDWDAITNDESEIVEGNPNGSIFQQPVILKKLDIKEQRNIRAADEVLSEIHENLGVDYSELSSRLNKDFLRSEKAIDNLEKAYAGSDKGIEFVNDRKILLREVLEQFKNFMLRNNQEMIELTIGEENYSGIITGYHVTGKFNPRSPVVASKIMIDFAVTDTIGKISIPYSRFRSQDVVYSHSFVTMKDSFTGEKKSIRTPRYAITGNLLRGLEYAEAGKVVSYKTHDGKVESALLMPKTWIPEKLMRDPRNEIHTVAEAMEQLNGNRGIISSGDGLNIVQRYGDYWIEVPRAKNKGGKYYLDQKLLDIVGGDFQSYGRMMRTDRMTDEQVRKAIVYLIDKKEDTYLKKDTRDYSLKNRSEHSGTMEEDDGSRFHYSLRRKSPPKKVKTGYKVFCMFKNHPGELFPPMVGNPGGTSTPVGVWLDADAAPRAEDSKTGRPRVQSGGKGTNAGRATLAYRPGWHLGELPEALQFLVSDPVTGKRKALFPDNFVFAECEFAADKDYQDEAMSYGYNAAGNFQHSLAGLPKIPEDGFYTYRTNPDPKTSPWFISGAIKVKHLLTDEETAEILRKAGSEIIPRKGGKLNLADWGFETRDFSIKRHKQVNPVREAGDAQSQHQDRIDNIPYEPRSNATVNQQATRRIVGMGGFSGAIKAMMDGDFTIGSDVSQRVMQLVLNSDEFRKLNADARSKISDLYINSAGTEVARSLAARRLGVLDLADIKSIQAHVNAYMAKIDKNKPHNDLRKQIMNEFGFDIDNLPDEVVNNPDLLDAIIRRMSSVRASKFDKAYEFWINSILSAPTTHFANTLGNTFNAAYELGVKRLAEATINSFAHRKDGARFGEFKELTHAINWRDALSRARIAYNVETLTTSGKLDHARNAIGGKAGRVIRTPGRLLRAADEFAKAIVQPMEAAAYAYREGKNNHLSGADLRDYIKTQVSEADSTANDFGRQRALELTFQEDPGKAVTQLLRWREAGGVFGTMLKFTLPFIKTPHNILKQGIRKSPLGALSLAWETGKIMTEKRSFDGEYVSRAAEQLIAWGIVAMLAGIDDDDDDDMPFLTGTSASYGSAEQKFKANKIPPYSIRIGGNYYSYKRIEPLSTGLAFIADGLAAYRSAKNGEDGTRIMKRLMGGVKQLVVEKSFLDSLGEINRIASDPERDAMRYVTNFVSSWMPNVIRQTVNLYDDNVRDNKSRERGVEFWEDQFQITTNRMGVTQGAPKLDYFGREITKDSLADSGPLWPLMRLVPIQSVKPDGNMNRAERLIMNYNQNNPDTEYYPDVPAYYFQRDGKKLYFSGDDYQDFVRKSGGIALKQINNAFRHGLLHEDKPTDADIQLIKKIFTRARKEVRDEMYRKRRYSE